VVKLRPVGSHQMNLKKSEVFLAAVAIAAAVILFLTQREPEIKLPADPYIRQELLNYIGAP